MNETGNLNGANLSEAFFHECGLPMLREKFPQLLPFLAAGLTGSGSECFGYDDELSRDHDFEPGFVLFLPGESIIDRKTAFLVERAYASLPAEYKGIRRSLMHPVGGPRLGPVRTADFFQNKTGSPDGILTDGQWLSVPEASLAEAVNGFIWTDPYGEVTAIRERLLYYPERIRLKKLAGHLLLMAQSGQYNYRRCILHNERSAAQLAAVEYVKSLMETVFLLNRVYQPYYKWSFRAMRSLPKLSLLAELADYLLTTCNEDEMAEEKYDVMESMAADIIDELTEQGLTKAVCQDLEKHAYSVNDGIREAELRNLHILSAV